MSADNGVYIGVFPSIIPGHKEYRVIEASAIENCDIEGDNYLRDLYRAYYYANANVFDNSNEAWLFARDFASEFSVLEYGVSEIEYDEPLQRISRDDADRMLCEYYRVLRDKAKNKR